MEKKKAKCEHDKELNKSQQDDCVYFFKMGVNLKVI